MADIIESEWNINTDIYDIVKSVDNLKSNYIQDQDESTLALGIFGFITDVESKKIQSSIIMTGEMGNEMFPNRANLTKNVLAHALYNNITDINAIPATVMLNIGIKLSDFEKYSKTNEYGQPEFVIDSDSPFSVINPNTNENIEFHVDYDIKIIKQKEEGVFQAIYRMDETAFPKVPNDFTPVDFTWVNPVSNITNPYLLQPFLINLNNIPYILIQTEARQYSITKIEDRLVSSNILENKTYTFEFPDQFVDMQVLITDYDLQTVTNVTPLMYGSRADGIENYCWFMFVNAYTIRIIFDHRSYIPGLNCKIDIKVYTSLGTDGEFKVLKNDGYSRQLYVELSSKKYNYNNITTYTVSTTDSENAMDAKTKEDLQRLIPKAALSRGSITTETDVLNYFNLIDTDTHRLYLKKKVDNQLSRIWFSYFLMKDVDNNIIPTNTLDIEFSLSDSHIKDISDPLNVRYVITDGTVFRLHKDSRIATIINESQVPDPNDDDAYFGDYYYYKNVYNIIINADPLYSAFYLTIINQNSWLKYDWLNQNSPNQLVGLNYLVRRSLGSDTYTMKTLFTLSNQTDDFELYREIVDDEGTIIDVIDNSMIILVLYNELDEPIRWIRMKVEKAFTSTSIQYYVNLFTKDNKMDDKNNMYIDGNPSEGWNLCVAGETDDDGKPFDRYAYFQDSVKGEIYTLLKFGENYPHESDNDKKKITDICKGLDLSEYTLTNIYELSSGVRLYEKFVDLLDTRITPSGGNYKLSGVPMVGYHYINYGEDYVDRLIDSLIDKKEYIEYCLELFENSIGIDYKFFNTYGPSLTYYIGDKNKTMINHIDLEFKFRCAPKSNTDVTIRDEIVAFIKDYIEDLYNTGDLHIPKLITLLMEKFDQRVDYIEYMNFNDFWLGIQHIEKLEDDELDDQFIVPEFLCIRNHHDEDGNLIPAIEVEMVTESKH